MVTGIVFFVIMIMTFLAGAFVDKKFLYPGRKEAEELRASEEFEQLEKRVERQYKVIKNLEASKKEIQRALKLSERYGKLAETILNDIAKKEVVYISGLEYATTLVVDKAGDKLEQYSSKELADEIVAILPKIVLTRDVIDLVHEQQIKEEEARAELQKELDSEEDDINLDVAVNEEKKSAGVEG